MDYDETDIAVNYDRGRDHGPEVLNLWMREVASHVKDQRIKTILDLGCGTGRFSTALAAHFDAEVIGIDPSKKMLEQAQIKRGDHRIRFELGRGESIPVPNNSVDLIFISMVLHHLENPAVAARECRRVLREQGICFLRTGTYEQIASYPYVEFFPASRSILEKILPKSTAVRGVFEAAGFREVSSAIVTQEISPSFAAYAEKLSAGADSVLVSLSPEDFAAGIQALQSHASQVVDQAVFEPIDVLVFQ